MGKPTKPSAPAGGSSKPKARPSKTANRAIHKKKSAGPASTSATTASASSAPPPPTKKRPHKPGSGGSIGAGVRINHFEQQRLDRIREKDERKAKKEEKLLLRKKERTAKLKILTKKNRKGQPVMGGRMELLLQKIQQQVGHK